MSGPTDPTVPPPRRRPPPPAAKPDLARLREEVGARPAPNSDSRDLVLGAVADVVDMFERRDTAFGERLGVVERRTDGVETRQGELEATLEAVDSRLRRSRLDSRNEDEKLLEHLVGTRKWVLEQVEIRVDEKLAEERARERKLEKLELEEKGRAAGKRAGSKAGAKWAALVAALGIIARLIEFWINRAPPPPARAEPPAVSSPHRGAGYGGRE